jgi:iron complex outermembrane receptor protein
LITGYVLRETRQALREDPRTDRSTPFEFVRYMGLAGNVAVITASLRRLLMLVPLLAGVAAVAFAQPAASGAIKGRILDSTGGALPGVLVSLKIPEGVGQSTVVTDGEGAYMVTSLSPSTYDVRAELTGFQTQVRPAIVRANDVTELNFTLAVGSQAEYVEVTARRRAEDLQRVPLSVTASTGDDLEAQSIQRFSDLGQVTPNFLYGQKVQSGSSAGQIYIRGIGQQDTNAAFSPGVGIYLDGVYLGRAQANDLDTADVERVEVLYGPQGTLFGKNSNGGAINITSKSPDLSSTRPRGTLEMQTGDFGRLDVRGILNVPLVTNKAALQVSGAGWRQDGYSVRVDGQDQANQRRAVGRAQLIVKPTDRLEALLRIDGTTFDEHSAAYRLVDVRETSTVPVLYAAFTSVRYDDRWVPTDDFQVNGTGPNRNAGNVWGTSLTLAWARPWGTVKSISAYRSLSVNSQFDPDGSPLAVLDVFNIVRQHQISEEVQAIGASFGGRMTWVGGLYYFRETAEDNEAVNIALEFFHGAANFERKLSVVNHNYAGFGQADFRITDNLKLTAGGRISEDEAEAGRTQIGFPIPTVLQPFVSRSASWTSFLPRIGTEYQWTPNLMTYVSAAEGSKSGGFNGRASSNGEFNVFQPEKVWTYELGLRSTWLRQRLRLNATAYYSHYQDFQIQLNRTTTDPETGQPIAFSFVGNMPKATIKGGEFALTAAPLARLKLSAGLGITDGKYVTIIPGAPVTAESEFVNAPKFTFTSGAEYSAALGSAGQATCRIDYIHKSRIEYDYSNSPLVAQVSYGLLNTRLTWQPRDSRVSFFLFGTNITNTRYAVGGIDDAPGGSLGEVTILMGPPRQWGVGAQYRF